MYFCRNCKKSHVKPYILEFFWKEKLIIFYLCEECYQKYLQGQLKIF